MRLFHLRDTKIILLRKGGGKAKVGEKKEENGKVFKE